MTCKIKRKPRSSLDVLRDSAQFISALPHSPPPKSRIPAPVLNSCPLWETHLETYSARARRQASSGPKSLRFYLSLLRSTFSINAATLNNLEHKQEALEMNGFAAHGLDEDSFGEKSNIVQAFDYFPKAKPQYVTHTSTGGKWTVAMLLVSAILIFSEFTRWWSGYETHTFSVEKGIGHDLQINLDIVVKMKCPDIHVNVQDAAGDRILAGDKLKKDETNWNQWVDRKGVHKLNRDAEGRLITGEGFHDHEEGFGEEHVHDIIAVAGSGKSKFAKTPKLLKRGAPGGDSCRIYGSLGVNKVQGDFHITARGHGYQEFGTGHLDHTAFNFSHIVSELSFGAFYPSLLNPLDRTIETTPNNFHKFQYFLSVVPTIYTQDLSNAFGPSTVFTNQYAVTEQSHIIGERSVPGIFFKYDIEPMLLTVEESRESFLRFVVKVVNVFSGVLVAGHWGFTLTEWAVSVWGKRKARSEGVLNGRAHESYD